jgi:hypothetical protein
MHALTCDTLKEREGIMDDESRSLERARYLAAWLNLPIADDELATVAKMLSGHDRERERMRDLVFLTEEPVHVFSPLVRYTTSKEE